MEGAFLPDLNTIVIDYGVIKERSNEVGVDEKMAAVQTIFHEYVHSFSAFLVDKKSRSLGSLEARTTKSSSGYETIDIAKGYDNGVLVYDNLDSKFNFINEAMTEGMAYDILDEYSQRTGEFSQKEISTHQKTLHDQGEFYSSIVSNMKHVCAMVGQKAGVDSQTVWNGFVRGIFRNGTLDDIEIKKWFAQAISPDFLKDLSAIKNNEDFMRLIIKHNLMYE